MPVTIVLTPTETLDKDRHANVIAEVGRHLSMTPHWHVNQFQLMTMTEGNKIVTVSLHMADLSIGEDSVVFFSNYVLERLSTLDTSFSLNELILAPSTDPKVFFSKKGLYPDPSNNSVQLKKTKISDIPREFCCSITGEIMDYPVYDIRTPNLKYEKNVLMYWVNSALQATLPGTTNIYFEEFLKTDAVLLARINHFVKTQLDHYAESKLESTLKRLHVSPEDSESPQNKKDRAFRRAAIFGDEKDLLFLASMGANVNATNPSQGKTALHFAIETKKLSNVHCLLDLKADVTIPDKENKKTFLELCETLETKELVPIVGRLNFFNIQIPEKLRDKLPQTDPNSPSSEEFIPRFEPN